MKITYKERLEYIEKNKATLTYRHGLREGKNPWAVKTFKRFVDGKTAKEAIDNAIYTEIGE